MSDQETNIEPETNEEPQTNAEPETSVEPETRTEPEASVEPETDEITYHAVEKDEKVTAIWEMRGRKHLRTIDPRSHEGRSILGTHEIDETASPAITETEG